MFETITQLGTFLSILIGGLIFFVVASLFGGDDDGHHDDGGAEHAPSFLSVRNLFLFAVGFGAGGVIGTHYDAGPVGASLIGLVVGLAFAGLAYVFFRSVRKQQVSTSNDSRKLVGNKGLVTETIPPGMFGTIRTYDEHGHVTFLTAGAADRETRVPMGTTVEIVQCSGNVAIVK